MFKENRDELLRVGKYNMELNDILGIDINELEIYRSKGLPAHMVKRNKIKKYLKIYGDPTFLKGVAVNI